MKEITVDQTKKIVFDYVSKLAKQHKLDPKKDIFNVVLPLENNQAISCYVGPNAAAFLVLLGILILCMGSL